MKITTNNVPRPLLSWYELTTKEQADFDYIDAPDDDGHDRFVRYHGVTYDTYEFMTPGHVPEDSPLLKWSGYHSDSFFSAVVLRWHSWQAGYVVLGTLTY